MGDARFADDGREKRPGGLSFSCCAIDRGARMTERRDDSAKRRRTRDFCRRQLPAASLPAAGIN